MKVFDDAQQLLNAMEKDRFVIELHGPTGLFFARPPRGTSQTLVTPDDIASVLNLVLKRRAEKQRAERLAHEAEGIDIDRFIDHKIPDAILDAYVGTIQRWMRYQLGDVLPARGTTVFFRNIGQEHVLTAQRVEDISWELVASYTTDVERPWTPWFAEGHWDQRKYLLQGEDNGINREPMNIIMRPQARKIAVVPRCKTTVSEVGQGISYGTWLSNKPSGMAPAIFKIIEQ